MPVAHGDGDEGIELRAQRRFQRARLALGEQAERRPAADGPVVPGNNLGAGARDVTRQRSAEESAEGNGNDVGVAEEVVEKRLDGVERVGTAELEEYNAEFFGWRHVPRWHARGAASSAPTEHRQECLCYSKRYEERRNWFIRRCISCSARASRCAIVS